MTENPTAGGDTPLPPENQPGDATWSLGPAPVEGTGDPAGGVTVSRWYVEAGDVGAVGSGGQTLEPGPGGGAVPGAGGPAYRLLRLLGRGGMGDVYEAIQMSLRRVVAVKRVRPHRVDAMDASGAARQFRQEASIAARLEHPNILPVHDLGEDEDGMPLLAMKLVEGEPWDRVIDADRQAMAPDDFFGKHIGILLGVAQAVAFAHSRGIVHRDIKPAQVMLGPFGEVMLTDWGLAVVVNESRNAGPDILGTDVLPTRDTATSPSGTPSLMAPEQTLRDASAIGPWTDVFLLGGTLYYILAGSFPYSAPSSREAFERAKAAEIEPPSDRAPGWPVPRELERLAMDALRPDIAERMGSASAFMEQARGYLTGASRRAESAALVTAVAARLDEPGNDYNAYSTALQDIARAEMLWPANPGAAPLRKRALAAHCDLALENGDTVLARVQAERLDERDEDRGRLLGRVQAAEAASRAQQRQRRYAIAAAFVLLVAVAAVSVVSSRQVAAERDIAETERARAEEQRGVAERERETAQEERRIAEEQRRIAEAARREAEDARALAVARARQVRTALDASDDLVTFMLLDLRQELDDLGRLDLLNDTVDRVRQHYTERQTSNLDSDQKRSVVWGFIAVAETLYEQGRGDESFDLYARARQLLDEVRPTADFDPEWATVYLRFAEEYSSLLGSRERYDESIEVLEELVAWAGQPGNRRKFSPRELADMHLALVSRYLNKNDWLPAIREADVGLDATGGLMGALAFDPGLVATRAKLLQYKAFAVRRHHGVSEAEEITRQALQLYRGLESMGLLAPMQRQDLGEALRFASGLKAQLGNFEGAVEMATESVELYRAILAEQPLSMTRQFNLAAALMDLARRRIQTLEFDRALAEMEEVVAIFEHLLDVDQGNHRWLENHVQAFLTRSEILGSLNRADEAEDAVARAVAIRSEVSAADPDNPVLLSNLAITYNYQGGLYESQRRFDEAVDVYRLGAEMAGQAVDLRPSNRDFAVKRIEAYSFLGRALRSAGRMDEAAETMARNLDRIDQALVDDPANNHLRRLQGAIATGYARLLATEDREEEALAAMERFLPEIRRLLDEDSTSIRYGIDLAAALTAKAIVQRDMREFEACVETCWQVLGLLDGFRTGGQLHPGTLATYSEAASLIAFNALEYGDAEAAVRAARLDIEANERAIETGRTHFYTHINLANAHILRARALVHARRGDEARAAVRHADILLASYWEETPQDDTDRLASLGRLRNSTVEILHDLGDWEAASALVEEWEARVREVAARDADDDGLLRLARAWTVTQLRLARAMGRPIPADQARQFAERGAIYRADKPEDFRQHLRDLAFVYECARDLASRGDAGAAVALALDAAEAAAELAATCPEVRSALGLRLLFARLLASDLGEDGWEAEVDAILPHLAAAERESSRKYGVVALALESARRGDLETARAATRGYMDSMAQWRFAREELARLGLWEGGWEPGSK